MRVRKRRAPLHATRGHAHNAHTIATESKPGPCTHGCPHAQAARNLSAASDGRSSSLATMVAISCCSCEGRTRNDAAGKRASNARTKTKCVRDASAHSSRYVHQCAGAWSTARAHTHQHRRQLRGKLQQQRAALGARQRRGGGGGGGCSGGDRWSELRVDEWRKLRPREATTAGAVSHAPEHPFFIRSRPHACAHRHTHCDIAGARTHR